MKFWIIEAAGYGWPLLRNNSLLRFVTIWLQQAMFTIRLTDEFDKWLQNLRDIHTKTANTRRLRQTELGNLGDHKNLGDGLWELRLHLGPGYRIYCMIQNGCLIIVNAGGAKSTQAKDN